VTLASGIRSSSYGSDPQTWLDALAESFPSPEDVSVKFQKLEIGAVFFRKLAVHVAKDGVRGLAKVAWECVAEGDEEVYKSVEGAYLPHLSLL
jgi:2',3'-cyclic-nucleotide 3'-phosphodiesterase